MTVLKLQMILMVGWMMMQRSRWIHILPKFSKRRKIWLVMKLHIPSFCCSNFTSFLCWQFSFMKIKVLMVYSNLAKAFVNPHIQQKLVSSLDSVYGGILQKQIFKAKDYPRGDGVQLFTLEFLLKRNLKLAMKHEHTDFEACSRV